MSGPDVDHNDDELSLLDRGYSHSIKAALIFLLAGGGFLASARFLGLSAMRLPLAGFAEFLGWSSLASSTAVLLYSKWRSSEKQHSRSDLHGLSGGVPWKLRIAAHGRSEHNPRSETIDRLYSELRPLMSRAAVDPKLEQEVQAKLSLLRELQSAEADQMEKRFEASLLLKPGEGWQALKRADELLARYESPSSPDAPTERQN